MLCGRFRKKINSDAVLGNFCLAAYMDTIYCTNISLVQNENFQFLSLTFNLLCNIIISTQLCCKSYTVCN